VDAWIRTRWLSLSGGVDFSFLVRYVFQKTDRNKRMKTAHLIAYVRSPIIESPLAKCSQNARLVGPIVQMAHQ
jgi:hypothetical protein